MPRWALGTVVVAPFGALLGQGRVASVVDLARGSFVVLVLVMAVWLVLGSRRPAL